MQDGGRVARSGRSRRGTRRTPRAGALLSSCAALAVVAACSLGPRYHRPDLPPPPAWSGSLDAAAPEWPGRDWWRGFASGDLDELIAQAQHANDDLRAAVARVHQADAQRRIAGAPLLPALDAQASAQRARAPVSGRGLVTGNTFSPLLSASYELDFWGKNRAAYNAAAATARASAYDRTTVELAVMAGVATTYFQALELRDRLAIAEANLANAPRILKGLKLEQVAGTATALDVAQQETVVATVNAAVPPLKQQLRQSIDALAILTGNTPESLDVTRGSLDEISRPTVRPGLPSELLQRRPDVAAAEAQLIAANADIAQARAAFFPSISLTASGGYASPQLASLLEPASRVWSLGAGITQPIFRGGALLGQYRLSQGRYEELLADYHKAVLAALANVEDSLAGVTQTADQVERLQQAATQAGRAYEFAQAQMRAGTINVLTLLNTESALFSARDALAQAKFAHLQAVVSLYQALGGGWQEGRQP
ncbi:MAG TPA: efflux transporter outer membrane subunit [Steroidobacteraceae bacterium]|nr:efflux transporter outer membrane subunit [Steroidobacteraceae bacterium]